MATRDLKVGDISGPIQEERIMSLVRNGDVTKAFETLLGDVQRLQMRAISGSNTKVESLEKRLEHVADQANIEIKELKSRVHSLMNNRRKKTPRATDAQ